MGVSGGPNIVRDSSLILELDAADQNSYPGSGTVWADLSGNNSNGALVNSPTFSSANGGSIIFNGTNQYVTDTINIAGTAFTVICWVYSNVTPNSNTFFSVGTASVTRRAIHLRMVTNTSFLFGMFNDDLSATVIGISGVWNCFAVTLTAGFVQSIYINGIFNTSRTAGGYYAWTTTCNIGRFSLSSAEYVNGNIPIVQVYNRALSAAEISQNYNALKSRFGLI